MKRSQYTNELTTEYVIADKILCSEGAENTDLLFTDTLIRPCLNTLYLWEIVGIVPYGH